MGTFIVTKKPSANVPKRLYVKGNKERYVVKRGKGESGRTGTVDAETPKKDVPESFEKVVTRNKKKSDKGGSEANLGSKLDYQFGKAGGNKHNVDRTKGLKAEMDKLGFDNTVKNRAYFEQYYNDVLNDSSNIVGTPEKASYMENGVTHYYTVTTRESFLMGKYGGKGNYTLGWQ